MRNFDRLKVRRRLRAVLRAGFVFSVAVCGIAGMTHGRFASGDEPNAESAVRRDENVVPVWYDDRSPIIADGGFEGNFQLLPNAPAKPPSRIFRTVQVEPRQPFDTPSPFVSPLQPFDTLGSTLGGPSLLSPIATVAAFEPMNATLPAVERVAATEQVVQAAADAGELLQNTETVQTVDTQRRSPVAFDPHVRGYTAGQVYTSSDGALWVPVRQDLDSMLSKIDPSLIQSVSVIPGPYGLRYGPGFAFIDVVTNPTPRYQNGAEAHSRTGTSYRANGEQWYGRETIYGGGANYGYIVAYGNRTGNDYAPGGNAPVGAIPSSYHNQNFLGQIGFDVTESSNIEFRYQRLDQTNTEYAAQFFDVDDLVTDGFQLAFNSTDPFAGDRFKAEGWYNRTRFDGDTDRVGKRNFHVIDRVEAALQAPPTSLVGATIRGITAGNQQSTGARAVTTYGDDDFAQLSTGVDARYTKQNLTENFSIPFTPGLGQVSPITIDTNMPTADMVDPGMFTELKLPVTEYWTTTLGGRLDWVHSDVQRAEIRTANTSAFAPGSATPSQNDNLYAFYLTNEVDITSNWTANVAFGHAQRAPSLVQRYADGVFLGLIQSGFSRVIGNPGLQKERDWQIDLALNADYDFWRGRLSGFHAWVDDYITYEANVITDPTGARLLRNINTKNATLAGFELYGEVDVTNMLTMFGSLKYVEGRDHAIDQPLPGISPLESKLGLRIQDAPTDARWGTEFGLRIVDNQDRLASLRNVLVPGVTQLETATPGFTTAYVRSFYNYSRNMTIIGGVDNLFDRTYYEHLDLRLQASGPFPNTIVYSPGITPYVNVELTY